ncbi:MAG: hypothetical protein U9Q72_02400 [Patescibacteria group bacterium]|nr:hypothetical protein [Patescibacteria group bacterium]
MKKINYKLETLLSNSNLSDEDKKTMRDSFEKMAEVDQFTFITLIKDDHSKLETAVQFLKDFGSLEEFDSKKSEEYLLSTEK